MGREVNANFYVALGVGANALWGAAFIIPYALHDFPAELITIFRYLVYGITSIAVLLLLGLGNVKISLPVFMVANAISLCGNVGYYLFLTMGVKYSGFVYPALIIGLLPVSVIVLGVFQDKQQSFFGLLPGIGLIVFGVVLINLLNVNDVSGLMLDADHVRGIIFSFISLLLLTIYCIANASFLKSNVGISSLRWAGLLGICALMQSLLLALFAYVFAGYDLSVLNTHSAGRLVAFIFGVLFLGVFVSYVAMWLWNVSSRHISSIVAGRILCLETIFALAYGYALDARIPQVFELLGICRCISGSMRLRMSKSGSMRHA